MKRANGMGTIIKLTGNRRKPWAIRRVIGWKEDGRPKIKYQGYYRTRREAEIALNEYNADPYTISKKTFDDVYNEWYASRESTKADNTLKGYDTAYKHLAPLHDMRLKDIDRNVLQRFVDDADITQLMLGKTLNTLNLVLTYAVKRHILPFSALNLTKAIDIPYKQPAPQKGRIVISKADILRLWDMKDDPYARATLFYIYTGLRFSELQEATPDCWHDTYIEIRKAKTKAGVRIVPICDKLQPLLPIMKIPSWYRFEKEYKRLLPDHTIHETRHTFITMMTENGIDPRIIKVIVGHSTNDITDHYTHISFETLLDAVNTL